MRIETRPQDHPTATTAEIARLLVSFELSQSKWVLTVRAPGSAKLSRFTVAARDTEKVLSLLTAQRQQAERRTGRPVRIVSIYEAGLDGFWLHRWLEAQGVESHVVDAASILGPQRKRNAKTDRIDGEKLLRSLASWLDGEVGVCSMVVPPSVAQEDIRRLSRERGELVGERTRLSNRIGGLLANQGIAGFKPLQKDARQVLQTLRTGDGRALPPHLHTTIERILLRLELLCEQIKAAEAERDALLRAARVAAAPDTAPEAATAAPPEMAAAPVAVAAARDRAGVYHSAVVGVSEQRLRQSTPVGVVRRHRADTVVQWRRGARTGTSPKPGTGGCGRSSLSSPGRGSVISPTSTLTQWFHMRIKGQSKRVRRIVIVALARKLLVALWRYTKHGVVPQGAVLKAA